MQPDTALHVGLPSVSVVIGAYNAASFIGRAIESALEQTGVELEIIIVDDGSSDNTAELAELAAERDHRIKAMRLGENQGPSAAGNAGFAAATSDWIAVLDSDDTFLPGRLAQLIRAAEDTGADLIADNFLFFDANTERLSKHAYALSPKPQVLSLLDYLEGARPYTGEPDFGLLKPVFRSAFLSQAGIEYPVEVRHGEDFEFVVRLLKAGARYVFIRTLLGYVYTRRSSGWSRTPVDYTRQVARTRWLAEQPELSGDPALVAAFEKRAYALARYHEEQHDRQASALARAQANPIARVIKDLITPKAWRPLLRQARDAYLMRKIAARGQERLR